ncbi:hypothetical protein BDW02DRAFT_415589 [Decorospora gaudefroyi]|uniref:Uncharacterized protein n=1 Tax=Decorospora gaudefroyi TaxID=184978 RepID=A0A6A5KT51_9PLEO|nr:hypothetical protein BDW02DRAFT_415589 [Decorospora gaudefroyi]
MVPAAFQKQLLLFPGCVPSFHRAFPRPTPPAARCGCLTRLTLPRAANIHGYHIHVAANSIVASLVVPRPKHHHAVLNKYAALPPCDSIAVPDAQHLPYAVPLDGLLVYP